MRSPPRTGERGRSVAARSGVHRGALLFCAGRVEGGGIPSCQAARHMIYSAGAKTEETPASARTGRSAGRDTPQAPNRRESVGFCGKSGKKRVSRTKKRPMARKLPLMTKKVHQILKYFLQSLFHSCKISLFAPQRLCFCARRDEREVAGSCHPGNFRSDPTSEYGRGRVFRGLRAVPNGFLSTAMRLRLPYEEGNTRPCVPPHNEGGYQ